MSFMVFHSPYVDTEETYTNIMIAFIDPSNDTTFPFYLEDDSYLFAHTISPLPYDEGSLRVLNENPDGGHHASHFPSLNMALMQIDANDICGYVCTMPKSDMCPVSGNNVCMLYHYQHT